jgi:hypothetical protein
MPLIDHATRIFTDPWNLTMAAGVVSYATALAGCVWAAWASHRARGARWPWLALAAAHAFLVLDLRLSLRHELSNALGAAARDDQWYLQRWLPQIISLGVIATLVLAGAVTLMYRAYRRRAGAEAAAALGTLVSLALFTASVISLHAVDAVFYRMVGPFCAVAYGWIAAGGVTALAAMSHASSMRRKLNLPAP